MMNTPTSQKMSDTQSAKVRWPVLLLWLPLAACSSVDVHGSSNLPADQQSIVDANRQYPTFREFPQATGPFDPARDVAMPVAALNSGRQALGESIAALSWDAADAAALAGIVRARLRAAGAPPEPVVSQEALQESLARARQRGAAPPPVRQR